MNEVELQIVNEYKALQGDLTRWGAYVDSILMEQILPCFIEKNQVKILPRFRIKSSTSLLDKILYRKHEYKNPLLEVTDKVATRVVMLKSDEIAQVASSILENGSWHSYVTKNMTDQIEDQPKVFDYQSCHIIVTPNDKYDSHEIDRRLLSCEIQIRTLLQHAFAEVSHDSTYKGLYRNDSDILRRLAKSMALMEATDDYFCIIFNLMNDEKRSLRVLLQELTTLFNQFIPTFTKEELNLELTDRFFELLGIMPVTIEQLERFISKRGDELKRGIQAKNGVLFTQPVIILIAYYLFNHQGWLKDNWPLNTDSLHRTFTAFNIQFEPY